MVVVTERCATAILQFVTGAVRFVTRGFARRPAAVCCGARPFPVPRFAHTHAYTMKSFRLSSALLGLAAAAFAPALVAQVFVGSDNFNDNTLTFQGSNPQAAGQWRTQAPNDQTSQTGGSWVETSGRLEYQLTAATSTTGINHAQIYWVSPSVSYGAVGGAGLPTLAPYTSSWTARIDATNLMSLTGTQYSVAGFEIYTTGNVTNVSNSTVSTTTTGFWGMMLENYAPAGMRIRSEWGVLNTSTYGTTNTFSDNNTYMTTGGLGTTATLQMAFDATTKQLTLSYSPDAGATFYTAATLDLDGAQAPAQAPLSDGIGLRMFVGASNAAGTIGAGTLYFDNLSVTASAVPEPSTYAALAGLGALGLVFWRRRLARNAAATL